MAGSPMGVARSHGSLCGGQHASMTMPAKAAAPAQAGDETAFSGRFIPRSEGCTIEAAWVDTASCLAVQQSEVADYRRRGRVIVVGRPIRCANVFVASSSESSCVGVGCIGRNHPGSMSMPVLERSMLPRLQIVACLVVARTFRLRLSALARVAQIEGRRGCHGPQALRHQRRTDQDLAGEDVEMITRTDCILA